MQDILLPMVAGLTLGSLHALDADHVAAVSVFVSRNPRPRQAMKFGVRWALGHTTTLLLFGLVVISLKLVVTPFMEMVAEVGIGFMLIAIGAWALNNLLRRQRMHIHRHMHDGVEHVHFHSHGERSDHLHEHSVFLIGAAHGLAGTASVLVVVPVRGRELSPCGIALYPPFRHWDDHFDGPVRLSLWECRGQDEPEELDSLHTRNCCCRQHLCWLLVDSRKGCLTADVFKRQRNHERKQPRV